MMRRVDMYGVKRFYPHAEKEQHYRLYPEPPSSRPEYVKTYTFSLYIGRLARTTQIKLHHFKQRVN
jgi:hypothetical protein